MTELKRTIVDDKVDDMTDTDRTISIVKLGIPDLYSAKTLAENLGVGISKVWEWRRMRGIYKSSS